MSLRTEPPKGYTGPPPPPSYTYPPSMDDPTRMTPTSLPPMASLLRHDHEEQEAQSSPYVARQFQPPYNMTKHPLWLAQFDPNAPVQHIYYPPQPPMNSHSPQNIAESSLVALQPQLHLANPSNQGVAPQRRTAKKIALRRDIVKDPVQGRRGSAELSIRYQNQGQQAGGESSEASYTRRDSKSPRQMPQSRSMPISGLLSDGPSPVSEPRRQPTYRLRMRQQPIAARACGFGERDRRVIDPPPILQMDVGDPNSSPEEIRALIRQPYSVVHCVLWDPATNQDDTAMPGTTEKRQQRRLMGTLVASPFVGNDEHGVEGCFFTFPDLSVRTPGTYSLKFSLINLDPTRMMPGSREPVKSIVWSSVFHVYNAKEFQGMRASTELTKTLKHQGCLISVKKGNNKAHGSRSRGEDDEEEEEEEDSGGEGSSTKRGKRPKR
ncbi:uncharacterized protein LY89DRAFT_667059 [Mollisia scopiformis]|uniref:Velvet domain-containing protein n=1 Tax=Mollisia scopiformis TaxID=149040 RepID=A0A194XH04_MOLSC|nr:uncharacterized protein LY89DRAFT_667059 [Mollisia scopiformis]KUJ19052.1 hypothetical protein LY89DRAFT_667059 [Mollisia scopiformis]